ncbi:DUF4105 domain-containing protein [Myxococcus sp. K38C18041901]|uniref:lipoprotein N-acyltransferase Lnb domain-containing protein n=1 Tax=Myxococcus guangdongensis TaxID=2906760 RepID=UPI0020A6EA28|nr:DUF4105 domain-containing protein [Myxococcus guangdongensis]MCP3062281.1 DUF4105 domain-containing protein [Myxococcus guangdongensis]
MGSPSSGLIILALCLLWSAPARATVDFLAHPEDVHVKLVTFGPGPHLHERFGHVAVWAEDTRRGARALYSYGVTSYGRATELRLLMERPTYWAARLPLDNALLLYRARNRSIFVQELDLSVEQRRRLLERLERDVKPETRTYAYDPLRDNCATRLRDALDEALGGALRLQLSGPAGRDEREHLRDSLRELPVTSTLLMLWLSDDVDAPMSRWQEAAFPRELSQSLDEVRIVDDTGTLKPLVLRGHEEHLSRDVPPSREHGSRLLPIAVALGACALLLTPRRFERGRAYRVALGLYHALIGATVGAAATAGFALMLFSVHPYFGINENQWLANPLTMTLLPLGLLVAWGHPRAEVWVRGCVGLLVLGSLVPLVLGPLLPSFDQDTREVLPILVITNAGLGLIHAKRWWHSRPARSRATVGAEGLSHRWGA